MKKTAKELLALVLAFVMALSLASCSKSNEMTEENVIKTVLTVETALKEFDAKTLSNYVESDTLSYILKFAEKHEQFAELGRAIFQNLSLEIEEIDLENGTVTVTATNRDLAFVATNFAVNLKKKYNGLQLLKKLDDSKFLNSSLGELVKGIRQSDMTVDMTVTLKVIQGKKNLVLGFDENAENAVSGGALTSIKRIYE